MRLLRLYLRSSPRLLEGAHPKPRSEVKSLLEAAPGARSFLENVQVAGERSFLLTSDQWLGDFKVLGVIGGAMWASIFFGKSVFSW